MKMKRKIKKKYRYTKPVKPLVIKGIICTWNFTTTGRLFVEG
jgi:hypothetical protein